MIRTRVAASGVLFDTETAASDQRSASHTAVLVTSDGTVLASCRLGSERESGDGHAAVLASADLGASWELRYLGLADRLWDGTPGETRAFMIAETAPGELCASVLWTDRSDPARPWVNQRTQGLLPMRSYLTVSRDGGRTWGPRRELDLSPYPAASPTGPLLRLPGGVLAQPFEHWKEYDDPSVGRPSAHLRLSRDGGGTWPEDVIVARHPENVLYYWDQRFAVHPDDGRLVAMFWTYDRARESDVDIHVTWGAADGRTFGVPLSTGLPGQHCQPIALGGDRLMAVYSHRRHPPGIRAVLSADFGRTWDRETETVVYASGAGAEPGTQARRSQADHWNDMGAWQFGHPRGVLLPTGDVLVVFYAGTGVTRSARWARLAL